MTPLPLLRAALSIGLLALAPRAQAGPYPLCPGASWTSARPLVAVAPVPAASSAKSLRDILAAAPSASGAPAPARSAGVITASAARNNLDPLTWRAYFGDEPESAAGDAAPARRLPDELRALKNLDDTKGMVAPGGGTRPGGLEGVPKGVPVAFGVDGEGNTCVRPATADDWKLDGQTHRISRVWDPKGFRDVSMLVKFDPDVAGHYRFCTVTRVAPGFAITAAHCVIDSGRGQAIALHDYAGATARSLVLTPRPDETHHDVVACFTQPANCGYDVSTPLARATLRQGTQWPANADAPVPDVALLAVAFNPGIPTVTSGIGSQAGPSRLTIAGFGNTDAADVHNWGDLLVGWQQSTTSVDDKQLVWSVDVAAGQAGVCTGDSGGPVFLGDFAGLPGEAKRIGAVVSTRPPPGAADATNDETMKCTRSGTDRAARLDTEMAWICAAARSTIAGCTGFH